MSTLEEIKSQMLKDSLDENLRDYVILVAHEFKLDPDVVMGWSWVKFRTVLNWLSEQNKQMKNSMKM